MLFSLCLHVLVKPFLFLVFLWVRFSTGSGLHEQICFGEKARVGFKRVFQAASVTCGFGGFRNGLLRKASFADLLRALNLWCGCKGLKYKGTYTKLVITRFPNIYTPPSLYLSTLNPLGPVLQADFKLSRQRVRVLLPGTLVWRLRFVKGGGLGFGCFVGLYPRQL